jgi:hypothetical protein
MGKRMAGLRPSTIAAAAALVVTLGTALPALAQLSADDIAALQKQGEQEGWTFAVGANPATARPLSELCGLQEPDGWWLNAPFDPCTPQRSLPEAYNWCEVAGCPPVRNQGGCGSCWAFATMGPLECNILIKDGTVVNLSEQWLVSCNRSGYGCGGGWWAHEYHQWTTDDCGGSGAVPETAFPYVAWDAPCNCPYPHTYWIDGWAYVGTSMGIPEVESIKQAIHGPVCVGVYVNSAFQAYHNGVFNACGSGSVNHGVTLVGWDDNQGTLGVWILRNSWGSGWGESGYMRIEYGCSKIGYAATYVNFPGTPPTFDFEYPEGLPEHVSPLQPTTIRVNLSPDNATPVPGTGTVSYRAGGAGSFTTVPMNETNANQYEALLPGADCGQAIDYYFSAQETGGSMVSDPPDAPNKTHLTVSATGVSTIADLDFETPQAWAVSGDANDGQWDCGVPVGGGDLGDPPTDFDGSGQCWLTDNVDGDSDVDRGATTLTTSTFDLSGLYNPYLTYARWFSNVTGGGPQHDPLVVEISNDDGASWNSLETVGPAMPEVAGGWFTRTFRLADFASPPDQVKIRWTASDVGLPSTVEAGIDAFKIVDFECIAPPPGDLDGDGDVDLDDFATFGQCFGGTDNSPAVGCPPGVNADLDGDGDVDLNDFAIFGQNFTGSL